MRTLRVGILTYHFSENYGALMQAYGLRQWLTEHGCQAEFINYHPRYVEDGGDFDRVLSPRLFRKNLKIAYMKTVNIQKKIFGDKRQSDLFEKFRNDVLNVQGERLEDREQVENYLASKSGKFDFIICGSDQIWNASPQMGIDPVYFLAMQDGGAAKHISYAPSFGKGDVEQRYEDEIGNYIRQLDGVSVREFGGVSIISKISSLDAICVPDPSILLGDFSDLIAKAEPVNSGHIFCYALRSGEGIREVAEQVSLAQSAPIYSPYNAHKRWREIGETIYPSPAGWVASISKASFVVTNSFHGTALSILLRKPFLTVGLLGKRSGLNERARNLLGQLDLMDRFIEEYSSEVVSAKMADTINWEQVNKKIAILQDVGRRYLCANLEVDDMEKTL